MVPKNPLETLGISYSFATELEIDEFRAYVNGLKHVHGKLCHPDQGKSKEKDRFNRMNGAISDVDTASDFQLEMWIKELASGQQNTGTTTGIPYAGFPPEMQTMGLRIQLEMCDKARLEAIAEAATLRYKVEKLEKGISEHEDIKNAALRNAVCDMVIYNRKGYVIEQMEDKIIETDNDTYMNNTYFEISDDYMSFHEHRKIQLLGAMNNSAYETERYDEEYIDKGCDLEPILLAKTVPLIVPGMRCVFVDINEIHEEDIRYWISGRITKIKKLTKQRKQIKWTMMATRRRRQK